MPTILFLIHAFLPVFADQTSQEESCKIYCHGDLLDHVQRARIFTDCKHFVDMPMVHDVDATIDAFNRLENKSDPWILDRFIAEYFRHPGSEFESCDHISSFHEPVAFKLILDPKYQVWARRLHARWPLLCRKIKEEVKTNPQRFSLLYTPHKFIVPGNHRFREYYYWDTYWIIKGLIISDMYDMAKSVILSLADMIKRFGYVPTSGRVYHTTRTNPPVLAGCVIEYFRATNDSAFVNYMLPFLVTERAFWNRERRVDVPTSTGETLSLFHYRAKSAAPRPEAYKEDLETVSIFKTDAEKQTVYAELHAAAETGWDFSSRWLSRDDSSPHKNTLSGVRTSRIIPVDLNSYICWYDHILSELYEAVGNRKEAEKHRQNYQWMRKAIHKLFWNDDYGIWFDYDLDIDDHRPDFYLSNFGPLFTKCAHPSEDVYARVEQYLKSTGAMHFPGGVPVSFLWTRQQWDAPNGWAPVTHMLIESLKLSGVPSLEEAAFQLADKWVRNIYITYMRSNEKIYEMYNVERQKMHGGCGGEYDVQEDFAWSIGVVLDLLIKYGDRLQSMPIPSVVRVPQPLVFLTAANDVGHTEPFPSSSSDIILAVDIASRNYVHRSEHEPKLMTEFRAFLDQFTLYLWRTSKGAIRLAVLEFADTPRVLVKLQEGLTPESVMATFERRRAELPAMPDNRSLPNYPNLITVIRESILSDNDAILILMTTVPAPDRLSVYTSDWMHWLAVTNAIISGIFDYGFDVVLAATNFTNYTGFKPARLKSACRIEGSLDKNQFDNRSATRWATNYDDRSLVALKTVHIIGEVLKKRTQENFLSKKDELSGKKRLPVAGKKVVQHQDSERGTYLIWFWRAGAVCILVVVLIVQRRMLDL